MFSWKGAAGICVNDKKEVLMVLQGAPGEERKWTVPSGTLEEGETFEGCCEREFFEETGYKVKAGQRCHVKNSYLSDYGISVYVEYFLVDIIEGNVSLQDPDELIHEISWKTLEEIKELPLAYIDDVEIMEQIMERISIK